MKKLENIREDIVEGLFNNPKHGEQYINWDVENPNECGVTIIYQKQNEQFDIIIRRK